MQYQYPNPKKKIILSSLVMLAVLGGGVAVYKQQAYHSASGVKLAYPADKKAYNAFTPPAVKQSSNPKVTKMLANADFKSDVGKIAVGNNIAKMQQEFLNNTSDYVKGITIN